MFALNCVGDLIVAKCAKQKDGGSCGIFVLHFVEMLVHGKSLSTQCVTDALRAQVFKSLVEDEGNRK
jgi:Ulp1 family protease